MNETRAAGAFEAKRICAQCGLVIVSARAACPRCGASLADAPPGAVDRASVVEPVPDGGVRRRLMWIAAVVVLSIFGWSRSLLLTSEPIDADQRDAVMRAIAVLEHAGFSPEVVMLRHFANYRATDNWWNVYLGHQDAYAATNFPLGVMTLYPPFFRVAVDDTERAVILLHESQHLLGAGEDAALERVWRDKLRLGWTADAYEHTRVWRNTRKWTAADVPALFHCGRDSASDCAPQP